LTRDNALRKTRLAALAELYDEIWDWAHTKYDRHLVKRKVEAIDPSSRLFIIGEAHAEGQVRLTGINWFDAWGTLGRSGENLDAILRYLRYTVYPPRPVHLQRGQTPPKYSELTTVYTTDVFPCYPPGGGAPTPTMVTDALKQRFLTRELEILQPRVILLLGKEGYTAFHTHLLGVPPRVNITTRFRALSPSTELYEYQGALVVPFLHPSPRSGAFLQWLKESRPTLYEQPQVQALKAALELQR